MKHSTPREFFQTAEAEYADPAVWAGELYLEFHRGTYTSQLRTKQGNRRSEHLLREAELWAATAAVRAGVEYPAAAFRRLWQLVLLQQFHDILPGTSIAWVHRDAERNYEAIAAELEQIIADSLRALAGEGDRVLAVNAAPHGRAGVPALGIGAAPAARDVAPRSEGEGYVLDNGVVHAVIDARGLIISLVEVASGREVVPDGQAAGLFQLFRDTPTQWDAWDIDETYRRHVTPLDSADAVRIDDDAIVVERAFGDSRLVTRIALAAGARTVRLSIDVDWHEQQKLLKLAVPVDVHTDRAASEIQFGHITRPTHTNTSWDAARFETAAHRWVRVAEPGFGVAVTNDSTYGHDITRHARAAGGTFSLVRLSIIRGALFPDPQQDQGAHHLEVGIVVGADVADAVTEGYRTNLPLRVIEGAGDVAPLVALDRDGIVVESVKLAHDGSGDVVVRLYEALGERQAATLHAGFEVTAVAETDLLEREVDRSAVTSASGSSVDLQLRPFQLVTLRFAR